MATSDETHAWLADGIQDALTEAAKVLDNWMRYDPLDPDMVYGQVVDRYAAYRALGEAIKRNAVALAESSLAGYKSDRAKHRLEAHASAPVRSAIADEHGPF
jgi:hypothetical protein